ncbi:IS5 family transposase [Streptomyces deserti]
MVRRHELTDAQWQQILAELQIEADAAEPDGQPPGPAIAFRGTSRKRGRCACGSRWTAGAGSLAGRTDQQDHLLFDDRARPLSWQISPGQRGDSPMFIPVLDGLRIQRRGPGRPRRRPDRVRGDKAYSSRDNRAYLRRRGLKATIAQPDDQQDNRRRKGRAGGRPPAFDKAQYRRRSAVERCVSKWKQYRAVATRYDKPDYIFNGTLAVTAIVIWLETSSKSHQKRPSAVTGKVCRKARGVRCGASQGGASPAYWMYSGDATTRRGAVPGVASR